MLRAMFLLKKKTTI